MRRAALAGCLLWTACQGAAGVGEGRQAIVGGSVDSGDPAVVALVQRRQTCDQASVLPFCSGTLISPRVVLTAAHCVKDAGLFGNIEVFFGADTNGDPQGRFIVAQKTAAHPSYDASSKDFDIGLVQLAEAATVAPIAPATTALDQSAVGTSVRAAGFGVTAPSMPSPDGQKRMGVMMVSSLAQVTFQTAPGPAMTCAGDSGSPVFAMLGGSEQLVGVTSAGDPGCATYAINARVDQFVADFVQPFVDAAANAPVGGSASGMAVEQICQSSCTRDEDCPDLLACLPTTAGSQCGSNSGPGNWGATCATSADCPMGATCGRLWPDTCRCFQPCTTMPPAPMGDHHGCAFGSGAPSLRWPLALLLLSAALATATSSRRWGRRGRARRRAD